MPNWSSKRVNVQYNRINEPTFLTKFKKQVGFKEDHGLSEKFAVMPKATEDDAEDRDDEKPQIVQLEPTDISEEEFNKLSNENCALSKDKDIVECRTGTNLSDLKPQNTYNELKECRVPVEIYELNIIHPEDIPLPETKIPVQTLPVPPLQKTQITVPPLLKTIPVPTLQVPAHEKTHITVPPLLETPIPLAPFSEAPLLDFSNVSLQQDFPKITLPNSSPPNATTHDPGVNPPWWNEKIKYILQNKKLASRRYQKTKSKYDLEQLQQIRCIARRTIRRARSEHILKISNL